MVEWRPITVILWARDTMFHEQGAPLFLILWEMGAPFLIVRAKDPSPEIR